MRERVKRVRNVVVRLLGRLAPLVVLAVVAVGVPYGVFEAYVHVVSSPYFALENIEVRGLDHVERDGLLARVGLTKGMNVFDVDVEEVKKRAESDPWIRRAVVQRRLPDRVEVVVEEREPELAVVDGGAYALVDGSGEVFARLGPAESEALLALPLVTGVELEHAADAETKELLLDAIEVVREHERLELPALGEIHVDRVMGLSVVLADSGTEVRLGRGRYTQRLRRLGVVLDSLEAEARDVDYILIDQEEELSRVTVGRATARMDANRTRPGENEQ